MLNRIVAVLLSLSVSQAGGQPSACDSQAPVQLHARLLDGSTAQGRVVIEVEAKVLLEIGSVASLGMKLPAGMQLISPDLASLTLPSSPSTKVTTFTLEFPPIPGKAQFYFRAAKVSADSSEAPAPSEILGGLTLVVGPSGIALPSPPGTVKTDDRGQKFMDMPGVMK